MVLRRKFLNSNPGSTCRTRIRSIQIPRVCRNDPPIFLLRSSTNTRGHVARVCGSFLGGLDKERRGHIFLRVQSTSIEGVCRVSILDLVNMVFWVDTMLWDTRTLSVWGFPKIRSPLWKYTRETPVFGNSHTGGVEVGSFHTPPMRLLRDPFIRYGTGTKKRGFEL